MIQRFLLTDKNYPGLVARLTLGLVMFPHGAQKLLGMFGGFGFTGTMGYFTNTLQLNAGLAFLVIMTEFFGSLALLIGLATRFWSAAFLVLILGILVTSPHLQNGFFMNWSGKQVGEGVEYHLLVAGLALILLFTGGGALSVDKALLKK